MSTESSQRPRFTLLYNIPGRWVGTGWEFFDSAEETVDRKNKLEKEGCVVTMRPYHLNDEIHLGAAHR